MSPRRLLALLLASLACLAHARRRFVEATRVQTKGKRGRADEAIHLIGRLYGIEREYKEAKDDARLADYGYAQKAADVVLWLSALGVERPVWGGASTVHIAG